MKANKLLILASASLLVLTGCGSTAADCPVVSNQPVASEATSKEETKTTDGKLTRDEASKALADVANGVRAAKTKATIKHKTGTKADDTAADFVTYVFDAANNFAHISFAQDYKTGKAPNQVTVFSAGTEIYLWTVSGKDADGKATKTTNIAEKTADGIKLYADAKGGNSTFAQDGINRFIFSGLHHWHNGALGISYYFQQQDFLDAQTNKESVTIDGTTYTAGATNGKTAKHITFADEKYEKEGTSLNIQFDAIYPGTSTSPTAAASLHEPFIFEFKDNILLHWHNLKGTGNQWFMDYDNADSTLPDVSAATELTADEASALLATVNTVYENDASISLANLAEYKWPTIIASYSK